MDISTLTICPRCKGREEIQCHLSDHGWASCPDCSDGLPYADLNQGVTEDLLKDASKHLYNVCAELLEWIDETCPDVEFPYGFEDRLNSALAKAGRSIQ